MAHKLAHDSGSDRSAETTDRDGKQRFTRRQYVKLGTATAATLLVGGASVGGSTGATTDTGDLFWTDFSEGSL
ncbi:hypothetical protein [Halorubrum lipolyticum]|uniref:Uncharacterized protein n=1 Tax=Halorubrum lipolyticum DSM 21995 TaxID=1227482 RepID=M0NP15_9EURY|nr:hypothetical protein [Halorubrum lipolyticum]EMA59368.1 hypothetical protein C469_12086 [Halorubrum lipolyticum DSM 21995]